MSFAPRTADGTTLATPRAVTVSAAGLSISGASRLTLLSRATSMATAGPTSLCPAVGRRLVAIRYSTRGYSDTLPGVFQWGQAGNQPLTGDFDGDGKSDIAVFRPSDGGWYILRSSADYSTNSWIYLQWGLSTPTRQSPVTSIAMARPIWRSFAPGMAAGTIRYSSLGYSTTSWSYFQWGLSTDIP